MKALRWCLFLIASVLLVPIAKAQLNVLGAFQIYDDLENSPVITPRTAYSVPVNAPSVAQGSGKALPEHRAMTREMRLRYGFDKDTHGSYGVSNLSGESPNAQYRRARPFGDMEVLRVSRRFANVVPPGVVAVQGFHREVPDAASESYPLGIFDERARKLDWRWEVPEALRNSYAEWTDLLNGDRYAVLCLTAPDWKRDPTLLCFDGASGLRWRAEVPVKEAVSEYSRRTGEAVNLQGAEVSGDGSGWVFAGVTQDGSRVLLTIGWGKPEASLLFVFDRQGGLLRTAVFPERTSLGHQGWLSRAPTVDLFVLHLFGKASEHYLVDADGNLLGRFVDEQGHPIGPSELSDTHAYAVRDRKLQSGTEEYRKLLYELPKK